MSNTSQKPRFSINGLDNLTEKQGEFLFDTLIPRCDTTVEEMKALHPDADGPAIIDILRFREECTKAGTTPEKFHEAHPDMTTHNAVAYLEYHNRQAMAQKRSNEEFTSNQRDSLKARLPIARSLGMDILADKIEVLLQDPDASKQQYSRYLTVCEDMGVLHPADENAPLPDLSDIEDDDEEPF